MKSKLRIGFRLLQINTFDINKPGNVHGDEQIARGLQKYLQRREDVEVVHLYGRETPIEHELDVLVHFNPFLETHPQCKNILYLQNAFPKSSYEGGTIGVFNVIKHRFEGYLYTSEKLMKACLPGGIIPFATDPELLQPQPSELYHHPVSFVGNDIRGNKINRRYFVPALPFGLVIYGNNTWAEPLATACQGKIPMPDLPKLYTNCAINLNAHIEEHRDWDTVNLRVFDSLACGGFVLSDWVESLENWLGDSVVFTDGYEDEWAKLVRYLADPELRKEKAKIGQKIVLEHHSYAHRADSLMQYLHESL